MGKMFCPVFLKPTQLSLCTKDKRVGGCFERADQQVHTATQSPQYATLAYTTPPLGKLSWLVGIRRTPTPTHQLHPRRTFLR